MQSIIVTTLYLLAVLIPLIFTPNTSELFEFPKFLLLISGTAIITVSWVTHYLTTRKLNLKLNFISYAMLFFLFTQFIATIFSLHPYTSFWGYYGRFHGGLLSNICYTIIYFAATNWLDTKSTQKLLKIMLKTSIFVGLLAILEHYGVSLSCIIINYSNQLYDIKNNLSFSLDWSKYISNACWAISTNPGNRSFSLLGQPNWLAAYLIPNLFLVISLYDLNKLKSFYPKVMFAILLAALFFTRSRSGFVGLGFSYFIYWILLLRQYNFAKIKSLFINYTAITVAVAIIFGTPYTPNISSLLTRSQTPTTNSATPVGTVLENGGTESGDIRKIVWSGALKIVLANPFFGAGPETFAYTYYQVRPLAHNLTSEWDFLYNKAHNEYINMATGAGLFGLFAYLYLHYAIFTKCLAIIPKSKKTNQQSDEYLRSIYPFVGATIVSFTVTSFFGFSVIPVYFTLIIFAAILSTMDQSEAIPAFKIPSFIYFIFPLLLIYPLRIYYADTQYKLGKSLLDSGKVGDSISHLRKAVNNNYGLDVFHATLAESYAQNGQKDLALSELDINRRLNPIHLNFFRSRAKVYLSLATTEPSYYTNAAKEIENARLLAPTDPKLSYNLGLIYTRTNQLPLAEKALRDTITLKPNYQEPYYALTLLYEQTKQVALIPPLLESAKANLATYSAQLKEKMEKYGN